MSNESTSNTGRDPATEQTDGGEAAAAPSGIPRVTADDVSGDVVDKFEEIKRARIIRLFGSVLLMIVFGYVFLTSLNAVEFRIDDFYQYGPEFLGALRDYFPITWYGGVIPFIDVGQYWAFISDQKLIVNWEVLIGVLTGQQAPTLGILGEAGITLAMAVAGTTLGFPLALLFGILGSGRVLPFPFNFVFRGIMSSIRAIPALVWALIFIPLGGLGAFTATLAIATDTVGNLGRLFTDELEEVEEGQIEAMRTTGGSRPQTVTFGMLSQVHTAFIAWTLYIFEINVRIAVTLGIIGAAGLGQVLAVEQGLFNFTNMMATILVILVLIISVELFSQRIRARIRAEEDPMSIKELIFGFPERFQESLFK